MSEHGHSPMHLSLCASAIALACASPVARGGTPAEQTLDIPMKAHRLYFSERCIEVSAGDRLSFAVETPYPADFNIHHHTETATEYPVRRRIEERDQGTLVLAGGGEYCFMWQNPESRSGDYTIRLSYSVTGA